MQRSNACYYVRLYKSSRILLTIQIYMVSDRSAGSLASKIKSRSKGLTLSDFLPLLLIFSVSFFFFVFAMWKLIRFYRQKTGSVVPSSSLTMRNPSSNLSAEQDSDYSANNDDSTSKLDRKPDLFLQDNSIRSQSLEQPSDQPKLVSPSQSSQRCPPDFGLIFLTCFYFGGSNLSLAVVFSAIKYSTVSIDNKHPLLIALSCLLIYILAGSIIMLFQYEKLR